MLFIFLQLIIIPLFTLCLSPPFIFLLLELNSILLLLSAKRPNPPSQATYLIPNRVGSLLFLLSFYLESASNLGLLGLVLKLGLFPFSFWIEGAKNIGKDSSSLSFFLFSFLYVVKLPCLFLLALFFKCLLCLLLALLALLSRALIALFSTSFLIGFISLSLSSTSSLMLLSFFTPNLIALSFYYFTYGLSLLITLLIFSSYHNPLLTIATMFFLLSGLPPGPFFFIKLFNISSCCAFTYLLFFLLLGDLLTWAGYLKVSSRILL